MPKHVFFDLDKTLTMSRSPMEPAHQNLFDILCAGKDVIVVTGGTVEQIREQVTTRFDGKYITLAQSGNQAIAKSGELLWDEKLSRVQIEGAMKFIALLRGYFAVIVKDEHDTIENRGAQIAYSVLGFHEDLQKKYSFDPDERKRQGALVRFATEREELRQVGIEVVPAGTTNFSFIPAGKHKGFNVARLVQYMSWDTNDCIYIGDALFPGGNDEVVIGVVPTHSVKDPDETFAFIKTHLL